MQLNSDIVNVSFSYIYLLDFPLFSLFRHVFREIIPFQVSDFRLTV